MFYLLSCIGYYSSACLFAPVKISKTKKLASPLAISIRPAGERKKERNIPGKEVLIPT